jgi:N-acetylglucosaminyldiphosphoundecaprenol N-acetyl-beta-D-mannosaminyltransferase
MHTKTAPVGRRIRTTTMIDGVAFDVVTEGEVIAHVLSALEAGHGGYIVTPNVDILRQLRRSHNRHLAERADFVLADGMPVVWASRLQKAPLPGRVPGSSLIFSLAYAAARQRRSVFLLGGAEQSAERAAERLTVDGALVAGWHSPPFGFESDAAASSALVSELERCAPDIVFVGLGFPKQERLILQLRGRFPNVWFLGCGGSLSFAAGDVSRAPSVVQSLGLEWLHRMAKEPRRLVRRYLIDDAPYTVGLLARASLGLVRGGESRGHRVEVSLRVPAVHAGASRVITLPDVRGSAPSANSRNDRDRRVDGNRRQETGIIADHLEERAERGVRSSLDGASRFAV